MKPFLLNIKRFNHKEPGISYEAVIITIEEDNKPFKGAYIPGPLITERVYLNPDEMCDFQKPDGAVDYDLIKTHCWVKLLNQLSTNLYNNYLKGKL